MVFTSLTLFARARGPDRYWKRRRVLSLTAHFFGRKQNCYSVAIRYLHRALRYGVRSRTLKTKEYRQLWETRINAGCQELGTSFPAMKHTMNDIGVGLDRKILQNLSIWEPRTFRALAALTQARQVEQGLQSASAAKPAGVVTRGML